MTPLGTLFRPGSCKPPKIDQHSLFTSIQVSIAVLEGDLQIYEPWKKKRSKPKDCRATLYVNETSPFLVWCKLDRGQRSSTSETPTSPSNRPRCVIPVSRAKLAKTAGGSFEMTDFTSKLTFRFVAKTVREAEVWVAKLAEESLREANLDMRSICSSHSSFSSVSGLPSPDPESTNRYFSFVSPEKRTGGSKSEKTSNKIFDLCNLEVIEDQEESSSQVCENCVGECDKDDVFTRNDCFCHLTKVDKDSLQIPSLSSRHHQTHVRAQPHLGLNLVLDKHRPELRSITDMPGTSQPREILQTQMPLSEYFVNVPDT